jgi:hypothetical protein
VIDGVHRVDEIAKDYIDAAAGHDRCVIPLTEAIIDAWLNPGGQATSELYQLPDDRSRPYYKQELAA